MPEKSVIRKRFTLVIPKKIRERLNLHVDDVVDLRVENESIIITPVREDPFEKLDRLAQDVIYDEKAKHDSENELRKLVKTR